MTEGKLCLFSGTEWLCNHTTTQALGAYSHAGNALARDYRVDFLQIRPKMAIGDAGDFLTDATFLLGFTSARNPMADACFFTAKITYS